MSKNRLRCRFAVLVSAVAGVLLGSERAAAADEQAFDKLKCFSVPSYWTGQWNPDPQHSYGVSLRFEWQDDVSDAVQVTFHNSENKDKGPLTVKISNRNGKLEFVDPAPNPQLNTTFTLRCRTTGTLEADLALANQGKTAQHLGRISFKKAED